MNWNLSCVSVSGDILVLCMPKFHDAVNVWILEHFIVTDSGNSYVFVGPGFRVSVIHNVLNYYVI
jgi:hypothetical protein